MSPCVHLTPNPAERLPNAAPRGARHLFADALKALDLGLLFGGLVADWAVEVVEGHLRGGVGGGQR